MEPVITSPDSSAPPVLPYASGADLIAKLTLSDKIIGGAAVAGLISMFMPAATFTESLLGVASSESISVIKDWRGDAGMLSFITAAVISFLILKKGSAASKNLIYASLAACALAPVLALLLFFSIATMHTGLEGFGVKITVGFGCYLFVLAGFALGAAGFLKARDAKLLPAALASTGT